MLGPATLLNFSYFDLKLSHPSSFSPDFSFHYNVLVKKRQLLARISIIGPEYSEIRLISLSSHLKI